MRRNNRGRVVAVLLALIVTGIILAGLIDRMREQGYEFERPDDATQVYCFLYGWYDNPNQRGA